MASARRLTIINISLLFLAVLLLLNLLDITFPSIGQARLALDESEPLCVVDYEGKGNGWNDIDRCCLEAKKQLGCSDEVHYFLEGKVEKVCKSSDSGVKYWLNGKAYLYCQQIPIW
jgi:hypothetical protein